MSDDVPLEVPADLRARDLAAAAGRLRARLPADTAVGHTPDEWVVYAPTRSSERAARAITEHEGVPVRVVYTGNVRPARGNTAR